MQPLPQKPRGGDPYLWRDLVKFACFAGSILAIAYLFVLNPTLSTPTLFAAVISMLCSPVVAAIERRGQPRPLAILIVFSTLGLASAAAILSTLESGQEQWTNFKLEAPAYFERTVEALRARESSLKERFPFLESTKPTEAVIAWGKSTGEWFVKNGASLVGDLLTWLFIVPLLTFFMLNDGPALRRRLFQMVPNRYFETTFAVTHDIGSAISDYLRAKLVEAFLVGLMVFAGLALIGAPYALVLGVFAGATNILPYLGPLLGMVPGLLIASLGPAPSHLAWGIIAVYLIANLIDNVVIFPIIVAKLVDLHPLVLIVAVIIGQQYYGLIGMLISIPVASALKVIGGQIHRAVYGRGNPRPGGAA
jgi:putative permease